MAPTAAESSPTQTWSSRLAFLLASVGFAVGLGNVWRFPYVVGENGGGAFLLVYLAGSFTIALPLLVAEMMVGRRGGSSPSRSLARVAAEAGASPRWGWVGGLAVLSVFSILTFYAVIAGWTLDFFVRTLAGPLAAEPSAAEASFAALRASPWRQIFWQAVVLGLSAWVVGRGVRAGIERAVGLLMPLLGLSLVLLVAYAAATGDLARSLRFLFAPDFGRLSVAAVLAAIGQAFFSTGIAVGTMMTYAAYLPRRVSIPRSAVAVVLADTAVSLGAGLAIFPLVFAYGLAPAEGPGLVFETLPRAFARMPAGRWLGAFFFLLLAAAALTSCIGALETVVSWVRGRLAFARMRAALLAGLVTGLVGLGTVLSFNRWSELYPLDFVPALRGKTIFGVLDFTAANLFLVAGGAALAVFAGWMVPERLARDEVDWGSRRLYRAWRFLLRWVAPPVLLTILALGLVQ